MERARGNQAEEGRTVTSAAASATTAAELHNAAWIRREIAGAGATSSRRRGMIDAHRDCIRTARYARLYRQLKGAAC